MQKNWALQEWRNPRKGDVVKDPEGSLGLVVRTEGDFDKRRVWVNSEAGSEMYVNEDPEVFSVILGDVARDFHVRRFRNMGLTEGKVCSVQGYDNVPMRIEKLEWLALTQKMRFWLRDMRALQQEPLKTDNYKILVPFELGIPENFSGFLDNSSSAMGYEVKVSLVERNPTGWAPTGSPLTFDSEETAKREISTWFDRLKVRRVASVINSGWKIDPVQPKGFAVRCSILEGSPKCYVEEISKLDGSPAYFPTALHAALAVTYLPESTWYNALGFTQDDLDI